MSIKDQIREVIEGEYKYIRITQPMVETMTITDTCALIQAMRETNCQLVFRNGSSNFVVRHPGIIHYLPRILEENTSVILILYIIEHQEDLDETAAVVHGHNIIKFRNTNFIQEANRFGILHTCLVSKIIAILNMTKSKKQAEDSMKEYLRSNNTKSARNV